MHTLQLALTASYYAMLHVYHRHCTGIYTCLNSDQVGGVDAGVTDIQVLEGDQLPLSSS
jgi:hypothetical protein